MKKTTEAKTKSSRDKELKQSTIARLLLVAIAALVAPMAAAEDGAVLIQNHNGGMPHSHGVGATFQAISANYARKADATATLVAVIKNGTQGMPPTAVSDTEARAMASCILARGR